MHKRVTLEDFLSAVHHSKRSVSTRARAQPSANLKREKDDVQIDSKTSKTILSDAEEQLQQFVRRWLREHGHVLRKRQRSDTSRHGTQPLDNLHYAKKRVRRTSPKKAELNGKIHRMKRKEPELQRFKRLESSL